MLLDANPEVLDPLAGCSHGLHYGRRPGAIRSIHPQQIADVGHCLVGMWMVRLVDHEDVRYLHDSGLDRLHAVTQAGKNDDDGRIRSAGDLELGLPHANGLEEYEVVTRRVED